MCAAAVSLQCSPKELGGEYPATKNVPRFISSWGWGCEGGVVGLYLSPFVYVKRGSRVLGEQRSLGMSGLYSLGIIWHVLYIACLSRLWDTS